MHRFYLNLDFNSNIQMAFIQKQTSLDMLESNENIHFLGNK